MLLEAFAAGVPAVAYDIVTGPAEIIRHGEDGLLVPPNDVESLAEAISRLMGDEALLRSYGEKAHEGSTRFAADVIVKQWEELFTELVSRRDDPRRMAERADRIAHRVAHGGAGRFHAAVAADRTAPSSGDQRAREVVIGASDRSLVRPAAACPRSVTTSRARRSSSATSRRSSRRSSRAASRTCSCATATTTPGAGWPSTRPNRPGSARRSPAPTRARPSTPNFSSPVRTRPVCCSPSGSRRWARWPVCGCSAPW